MSRTLGKKSPSSESKDVFFTNCHLYETATETTAHMFMGLDFWEIFRIFSGYAVMQLVVTLYYKQDGRGFNSRWCHWRFTLT